MVYAHPVTHNLLNIPAVGLAAYPDRPLECGCGTDIFEYRALIVAVTQSWAVPQHLLYTRTGHVVTHSKPPCVQCTMEDDRCEGHAIESLRRNPCATESA
jgi:hypothetical protein